MKVWNWGLVVLFAGLLLVPTTYFGIIGTDLPQFARVWMLMLWILGVIAVPVGFGMLVVGAIRGGSGDDPRGARGQSAEQWGPERSGLALVLGGLLLAPLSVLAVLSGILPRALELVAYAVGFLAVLAVPVGCMMYAYGLRQRDSAMPVSGARLTGATPATAQAGTPADLRAQLAALRAAGVLSDQEYAAKVALVDQSMPGRS